MSGNVEHSSGGGEDDRLELALRASNEGIWDWWIGQQEVFYSRRILEFLECSGKTAPNFFIPPHEPVHPDERERFRKSLELVAEPSGPELLAVDCRVRTGTGEWRWLRIRGAVVRDRDGAAQRIAGSMIDISRRKNAEGQIKEERHLLRLVIENVPLQVYFKNLESKFVLTNQQMAEWAGLDSPTQLIGKHDRDFFASEHWKQAAEDEREIIESGEPMLGVLEKETWQGREDTWVLSSKFPWRDRHGVIKGTFGVSSNVTELVMAQQQSALFATQLKARNEAYEEELQLAREIQQALLTGAFPRFHDDDAAGDLQFGARYVPISGLAGDFYEVLRVGPQQAGMLICDVMGHGVRAALVVAMTRGLVEKEVGSAGDPGKFLAGLNAGLQTILGRTEVTIFVTAFYAVVDLESGEIRCANAGHPGAIASGRDGEWQVGTGRDEKGPALGLVKGAEFPTVVLPLAELRRFVLFTDGLLEAENDSGEAFLEQRLLETLGESREFGLEETLDTVLARVLQFSEGNHFDDDVCVLGVDLQKLT